MNSSEESLERDKPLRDLIPQPLKWEGKVEVDLPPEARALMADLHNDRAAIGVGFTIVLILAAIAVGLFGVAVARYVAGWWRA